MNLCLRKREEGDFSSLLHAQFFCVNDVGIIGMHKLKYNTVVTFNSRNYFERLLASFMDSSAFEETLRHYLFLNRNCVIKSIFYNQHV